MDRNIILAILASALVTAAHAYGADSSPFTLSSAIGSAAMAYLSPSAIMASIVTAGTGWQAGINPIGYQYFSAGRSCPRRLVLIAGSRSFAYRWYMVAFHPSAISLL